MSGTNVHSLDRSENCDFIHGLLERRLASGDIDLPLLPEVAIRVMRLARGEHTSAGQLADIINADQALTMYVLRVAASAAKRPASPIVSLHHAVSWLGFDEVANIAFTLALQGKMLNIPGQNQKARRLWRHALASALWARHLGSMLARDAGVSYLCGLLHTIGKPVMLGAVHDLAQRARVKLSSEEYDRLVETFHRHVGTQVVAAWGLPAVVVATAAHWEAYAAAGEMRTDCNVVNVAHRLANYTLTDSIRLSRDLLLAEPAYQDIGFGAVDATALFDAAGSINADLDTYLPP
ncbi:MAG: HDOD domain-containing protein [Steroidobacteraceae bacterium]|jgi:HD-like signal output (HDOD) protein